MTKCFFRGLVALGLWACAAPCDGQTLSSTSGVGSTKLSFSAQPTRQEIFNARVFDEPLVPIGGDPNPEETRALANALSRYASRTNFDDFSSLNDFLVRFPDSAWSGSLLLHVGVEYYNAGRYSLALSAFERAWNQCKSLEDPRGKAQCDRALGELAKMYSKLGRMGSLENLLNSITNRTLEGPANQLVYSARQSLWMMQNQPGVCFRCGPLALDQILSQNDSAKAANMLIVQSRSTTNGFSLSQVAALSSQLGMNYQMAFRSPGASFIVPAVIHWKVGHYAALLKNEGGRFLVKDHTFHSSLLMTSAALEEEQSGYFLVPLGPLPSGWRIVTEQEAQGVWGKGLVARLDPNMTGPGNVQCGCNANAGAGSPKDPSNGSAPIADGTQEAGNMGDIPFGMTTYTINTMLASLCLNDTPVGYTPPVGPWVRFTATYNQNDANQPATFYYSNLGPDWTCNWIEYITDNPNSPGAEVSFYESGGGTLTFTGFNSGTQSYQTELMTQAILVKTSGSSYEMQFPSGAKREFGTSDGSTGSSRRIFLTQVIDPAGNSVRLNYDSSLRITNITDTIGQATTLAYTNSAFPYAITAVTDPFGRTANFQYNSAGMLTQITDVLGLTSQYTYGTNDFITALVTPYGTNTFSSGTTNGVTWLQATDPLGESELAEATQKQVIPASDPSQDVPFMYYAREAFNNYLNDRDTYYWDKKAFQVGAGDYTKAVIYHFFHETDVTTESGVLESVKHPLENRVWFGYPDENGSFILGAQSINRPSAVGRVLDDGTTQIRAYQYNALGRVVNYTDPVGRNFTYYYFDNNVDLDEIDMTRDGNDEILEFIDYNSQHEPIDITYASGQTTYYNYNVRGQLLATTDPLGEITSYVYDTNGFLLSITGPLQTTNDVTSFTYDGFGRVRTVTDTEGYTLTFAYDAMDRKTRITHSDGTFEQFVYSNLDLIASSDRLGRWTTNTFNADRQLVQARDPLGRITSFDWCKCGALTGLTDPMGRTTTWDYDVQSRPTAKHYVDGSTITYVYENSTSRLKSKYDEKGQQTLYSYYLDDNLKSVSYPNATVATPSVTYTYDPDYNCVLTMQDGIGTTTYTYNPISTYSLGAGMLASVSGPLPNSTVTYQYDQLGRATTRAINGVAQTVSYDVLGRPATVINALGTFQYSYVDATARLASEAYPNSQTNLYTYYNNLGDERLQQVRHLYPNGSQLSGLGYAYNAVGQITAWTNQWDTLPTRVWAPGYDAADQLTNVVSVGGPSGVTNYTYAYDLNGNRLVAATNGIVNNASYNALNQINSVNPGPTNAETYEWDAENRLTAINQGLNRSEFSYDGLGRRVEIVEKTNGVIVTNNFFLWCGSAICEERDATGGTPVKRYFGDGVQVVSGSGAGNYFYTKDHLGSIRELMDSTGTTRARYDYDPFGTRNKVLGNSDSDYGFTGFYYHSPSGLHLAQFRAYNSGLGRWPNRDPIGESGGINLYVYVMNDPINRSDRLGLCPSNTVSGDQTADELEKKNEKIAKLYKEGLFSWLIVSKVVPDLPQETIPHFVGKAGEKAATLSNGDPNQPFINAGNSLANTFTPKYSDKATICEGLRMANQPCD
jgi:RHS repeat-associated protein